MNLLGAMIQARSYGAFSPGGSERNLLGMKCPRGQDCASSDRRRQLVRNSIHLEGEILQFPVTFHLEDHRITRIECADNRL
jgi:hypothetical protein